MRLDGLHKLRRRVADRGCLLGPPPSAQLFAYEGAACRAREDALRSDELSGIVDVGEEHRSSAVEHGLTCALRLGDRGGHGLALFGQMHLLELRGRKVEDSVGVGRVAQPREAATYAALYQPHRRVALGIEADLQPPTKRLPPRRCLNGPRSATLPHLRIQASGRTRMDGFAVTRKGSYQRRALHACGKRNVRP
eukprot:2116718-Pleurochrysis_carterae.AAC.1